MKVLKYLFVPVLCLMVGGSIMLPAQAMDRITTAGLDPVSSVVNSHPAAYRGRTVIRTTEPLILNLHRVEREIPSGYEIRDIVWMLNGKVVSRSPELVYLLEIPGEYLVDLSYQDSEGLKFEASIKVKVMDPEAYEGMIDAIQAAVHLPLLLVDDDLFLPFVIQEE